jgi:DNA-binding XRE family transcriptional regulator
MTNFDPDFGKTGFARHLFRLRFRHLKLSQRAFAERFGLSYSVVRDAEQGARPTPSLRLIVAAIADDPERMEVIARLAARSCHCGKGDPYTCCANPAVTVAR